MTWRRIQGEGYDPGHGEMSQLAEDLIAMRGPESRPSAPPLHVVPPMDAAPEPVQEAPQSRPARSPAEWQAQAAERAKDAYGNDVRDAEQRIWRGWIDPETGEPGKQPTPPVDHVTGFRLWIRELRRVLDDDGDAS